MKDMSRRQTATLTVVVFYILLISVSVVMGMVTRTDPPQVVSGGLFNTTNSSTYLSPGWGKLAVYGGIVVILFYIGRFILSGGSDTTESRQKLLSTLFIIILAGFAFTGGVSWTGQILGENVLYNHANNFLNKQFTDASAEFELFLGVSTALDVVSSVKLSAVVVSVKAGALLQPITTFMNKITWSVWDFIISISIQKVLLIFGHRYAMTTLFPLGLISYLFPGFRKAGAFLIALSLALWIVFPLTVVVILEPVTQMVHEDPSSYIKTFSVKHLISEVVNSIKNVIPSPLSGQTQPPSLYQISNASTTGSNALLSLIFVAPLAAIFTWWAKMFIIWYFIPAINIVFFIIVVFSLTEELGGETSVFSKVSSSFIRFK
ncbi:hypothetical protein IPdc08_00660 [archaeon]|nr:hypothetical protein IPdc08_00660 [archaeon]